MMHAHCLTASPWALANPDNDNMQTMGTDGADGPYRMLEGVFDLVSQSAHDARVQDLLEANNRYLERARSADRELALLKLRSTRYQTDAKLARVEAKKAMDVIAETIRERNVAVEKLRMLDHEMKTVPEPLSEGAWRVLNERFRQRVILNHSPEADDAHTRGELVKAALSYAVTASRWPAGRSLGLYGLQAAPDCWPWRSSGWSPDYPYRDLVKAGALILAELERRDRIRDAAPPSPAQPPSLWQRFVDWFLSVPG